MNNYETWRVWKHKKATDPEIRYYVEGSQEELESLYENTSAGYEVIIYCIRNYAKSDSGHAYTLEQSPPAGPWPVAGLLKHYAEEGPYVRPAAPA
jgi:hypothetical protein